MWGSKHGGPNNGIIKHALHATEEGYKNNPLNYHLPTERRVIAQCCNSYQDILTHAAQCAQNGKSWNKPIKFVKIMKLSVSILHCKHIYVLNLL